MSGPNFCEPCGFYHPRDYDCAGSRLNERLSQLLLDSDTAARDGYREGYRVGFLDGRDAEQKRNREAGRRVLGAPGQLAPVFREPTFAELQQRRYGGTEAA